MRFTERFLLLLALIGFLLRATDSPQGAAMQLVSIPPLALFYLLFTPSLLNAPWREHYSRPAPALRVVISVLAGLIIAYCLVSVLFAGLGSFPQRFATESCVLGIIICGLAALSVRGPELGFFRRGLLIRVWGICGLLALVSVFHSGALPRIH